MKIQLLPEPELQFGAGKHIDIRFGLMNYGPLDVSAPMAPKKIRVGIVGDSESVEGIREWLVKCRNQIDAKETNKPNLFPRFPGFANDRVCHSELVCDPSLEAALSPAEIERLCAIPTPDVLVVEAVNALFSELRRLDEKGATDVLICALPNRILYAIDPAGAADLDEPDDEAPGQAVAAPSIDFRHLLKARGMELTQPIQLVLPATYDPTKRRRQRGRLERMRRLQDEATRAWNFHVALYYKAGGLPWRLIREPTSLESCFVGVSFYVTTDRQSLYTSIAQVFNERGLGVVVRGANASISKDDRQPHLDSTAAYELMEQCLERYRQEHKHLPARVVVHKSSSYSDQETDGFLQAIRAKSVDSCDLLNVQSSFKRLFRQGKYPPLRGTFLTLDDRRHLLYARGSVDFFATYPGLYVPRTVGIDCCRVAQTPRFLAQEVLALTKMNWNNTQFDGGMPITIRASRQVGKILRYISAEGRVQPRYSYYM